MKKLKKTLSLTLAFALSLAMAVPAMAAGTPKTVEDPKRGLSVTFNGYLMDTIFDSGERAEEFHSSDYHIYVIEDNSTIDVAALPGYEYAVGGSPDGKLPESKPVISEGHQYAGVNTWWAVWDLDEKMTLWGGPGTPDEFCPLSGPYSRAVSPQSADESSLPFIDEFNFVVMCKSDYDRLKAAFSELPATPATPTTPSTPAASGSYTVKKGDTWSSICTNFYGTNAQRYALMKANKGVTLKEGAVITLPEKLGRDTLIPVPAAAAGEKLYTVKAGDTLGKIAAAEYGKVSEYKAIFERNADRLKNANTIYEGQVIVLPVKK